MIRTQKDQLKEMYKTLLCNHTQLLELLHNDIEEGGRLEDPDVDIFCDDLMKYMGSLRKVIFSPEELAEKDQLTFELMEYINLPMA